MSVPRTWTLVASSDRVEEKHPCEAHLVHGGPKLTGGERVEVIEAEPVLDLLEGMFDQKAMPDDSFDSEIEALLRSHGRLQDGGS
jgi:hypothetical protein